MDPAVSVFQITLPLLYAGAAASYMLSRLPQFSARSAALGAAGIVLALLALAWHAHALTSLVLVDGGLRLTLADSISFVAAQLALIALIGGIEPQLRGLAGGLLLLAACLSVATGSQAAATDIASGWPLQAHILVSLFAYGLFAVGAIVAIFGLVHEKRLRAGNLAAGNHLFAPLETSERLLFGITAAGFSSLLLAVLSGLLFVDNLFAQHLVHKTVLSLLALVLFAILLAGRQFAGWRGRAAVSLYLWGFVVLCLAYFGSRFVLENLLGRSWG